MGDYRPEHLFTLKQSLDGYRYYQKLIAELDDEIARLMHTLPNATEHPSPIPKRTKRTAYQRMGNDPYSIFAANCTASLASISPISRE